MKIKRTKRETYILAIFLLVLPVVTIMRTHHLCSLLEPVTGFYASRDWTVSALGTILLILTVLSVFSAYFTRKTTAPKYCDEAIKSHALTLVSLFLGLCFLWDAWQCIGFFNENYAEVRDSIRFSSGETTLFAALMKTGNLPRLMEGIAAIPSAMFCFFFGADHFKNRNDRWGGRLLALFPVIWLIMRTIFNFTRTLSFMRVSELFYEILSLALLMIFFMVFAQQYSHINSEIENDWVLTAVGFPGALVALMNYFSRIITIMTRNGPNLTSQIRPEPVGLMLGLFAIALLMIRVRHRRNSAD